MDGKIDELINSVIDRVLSKLERDIPQNEEVKGTLAIITTYVPSPQSALKAIAREYGEDVECALLDGADFDAYGFTKTRVYDAEGQNQLVQVAAEKGRIVLVTPKISLLERIAQGDDGGIVEYIVLRALLWGRRISLLLDFEKPRFKRNTFFEKIGEILDSLTVMGIETTAYSCSHEKERIQHTLVTEREILDASSRGETALLLCPGAIVTPLAREKASELHIRLD